MIPWYCRKCQTQNDDIRADTCEECGEDFPEGWDNTKAAVLKLLKTSNKPIKINPHIIQDKTIPKGELHFRNEHGETMFKIVNLGNDEE